MTYLKSIADANILIKYSTKNLDCNLLYINQEGRSISAKSNGMMWSFKETFFARDSTIGFRFTNHVEECQPLLEERV